MERLTLNVLDTNSLKKVTTDLLTTNEAFHRLAIELTNRTDNDAGQIEPDDLATFAEYLGEYENYTTYYTAELLYMVQFAMDDVTAD